MVSKNKKSVSRGKKVSNGNLIIGILVVVIILGFVFGKGITGNAVSEEIATGCFDVNGDPVIEGLSGCMDINGGIGTCIVGECVSDEGELSFDESFAAFSFVDTFVDWFTSLFTSEESSNVCDPVCEGEYPECVDGGCYECNYNDGTGCAGGFACDATGICVNANDLICDPACTGSDVCQSGVCYTPDPCENVDCLLQQYCSEGNCYNLNGACSNNNQCPDPQLCCTNPSNCISEELYSCFYPECVNELDCPTTYAPECENNICVPCEIGSNDCSSNLMLDYDENGVSDYPVCLNIFGNNECVECGADSDCTGGGECDLSSYTCFYPPKTCCFCSYQEYDECSILLKDACIANHQKCRWYNDGTGATCMSRFKKRCSVWSTDPAQQQDCALDPDSNPSTSHNRIHSNLVDPVNGEDVTQCTDIRIQIESHSSPENCGAFIQQVASCLTCEGSNCNSIEAIHNGCESFNDIASARAKLDLVRAQLDSGQRMKVTGNQLLGSDFCSSFYTFDVAVDWVVGLSDECNTLDFCHENDVGNFNFCQNLGAEVMDLCCSAVSQSVFNDGNWFALSAIYIRVDDETNPQCHGLSYCAPTGSICNHNDYPEGDHIGCRDPSTKNTRWNHCCPDSDSDLNRGKWEMTGGQFDCS